MNRTPSSVKQIFYTLVAAFIFLSSYILLPVPALIRRDIFPLIVLLTIIFFLLGIALIYITLKRKIEGRLKKFLLLTGASATGFLISVLLHNFVYGIFIYWFGVDFWNRIGLSDEPVFFFIALIVCPIAFLIGIIGSIILFAREKE